MHQFAVQQQVVEIDGIRIGGRIGENPPVMIGSIFYRGHDVVTDPGAGEFDRPKTEDLINRQEELSDVTGLPAMYDVVASSPKAAASFLEFVAGRTRKPLLFDPIGDEAALKGLEYIGEVGLEERIIFNSINPETKDVIMKSLQSNKIKFAVLLTYSMKALTSSGERVNLAKYLLVKARQAGIEKTLVDTVVIDPPTLGLASNAIFEVKDKLGVPAGCGAHNAISQLESKLGAKSGVGCATSACVIPATLGADFVLYGPIEYAEFMFPAVALVGVAYRQLYVESGGKLETGRPRLRIV